MQIDSAVLSTEEMFSLKLRSLYRKFGYSCFKMNKFEEYDLYGRNKDFLISDSVITFTDTNGKLMALKPDVTLSIVKNSPQKLNGVMRLYYNENVYRISESTKRYKELMQVGLECIGQVDKDNVCEVVELAAESLKVISDDSVLAISHLGIISAALKETPCAEKLIPLIAGKNSYGIKELCAEYGVDEKKTELLAFLTMADGDCDKVVSDLKKVTADKKILAAADELCVLASAAEKTGVKVMVDLSLTSDGNYYNGAVFKGYVKGVPTRILSGGQYDGLMQKMGKQSKAVGFAVYTDLIERLEVKPRGC